MEPVSRALCLSRMGANAPAGPATAFFPTVSCPGLRFAEGADVAFDGRFGLGEAIKRTNRHEKILSYAWNRLKQVPSDLRHQDVRETLSFSITAAVTGRYLAGRCCSRRFPAAQQSTA